MAEAGDLDDTLGAALDAVRRALRRRSDQRERQALEVLLHRQAGYKRDEIEKRVGLTPAEYARAHKELREVLRPGADEN